MPHQRKYVAHSGGIAAWPSRAKRSMVAYASHGFSSRLSRSARCALLSFTSLTLASAETQSRATDLASVHPAFVFACDLSPRPTPAHCTYRHRHHDRNYIFLIGIVKNAPMNVVSTCYYWIIASADVDVALGPSPRGGGGQDPRLRERIGAATGPATAVDRREEVEDRAVERLRLLEIHRVAGLG